MSAHDPYANLRHQMVEVQLRQRDIRDARVLAAMEQVPRHKFVPEQFWEQAYEDGPLPIGENQTISQPYIVGAMTQLLGLKGDEHILEIGTGCGYQTAVLCEIAQYVYSLERFPRLAEHAAATLQELGYSNVDIHVGDGSQGLVDMSPYDAIIVTAAAPMIPGPLCSQLHPDHGRMVIPVGNRQNQILQVIHRSNGRYETQRVMKVRFVPLLGRYGFDDDSSAKV